MEQLTHITSIVRDSFGVLYCCPVTTTCGGNDAVTMRGLNHREPHDTKTREALRRTVMELVRKSELQENWIFRIVRWPRVASVVPPSCRRCTSLPVLNITNRTFWEYYYSRNPRNDSVTSGKLHYKHFRGVYQCSLLQRGRSALGTVEVITEPSSCQESIYYPAATCRIMRLQN